MPTGNDLSRRNFIANSTRGAFAIGGLAAATSPQQVMGANDKVRVAIVGVRGRGTDHLRNFSQIANVQVAALCDIDENVLGQRLADMEKMGLPKPKTYRDVRQLLEDKSIDAISIATPNHWHSLIGIWACQAGKDVYIEKPCSHNLWEGKQLVKAAQRYNRVVQHGTQCRSDMAVRDAVQKVKDGAIGETYMARGLCYKWRDTIGRTPVSDVPQGVDYNLWTGPAPNQPFTRNHFHYNWHWFWNYGNGDLGNQGVHQVDVARWGLGLGFPTKISAMGGHFMFDDDQETPNDLTCAFEFDVPNGKRKMITFEVRHWITNHEADIGTPALGTPEARPSKGAKLGPSAGSHNSVGNIFYGSDGYLSTGDEDAATYVIWKGRDQERQPPVHGGTERAHFQNFIDCVVARNRAGLNGPIEEGHISAGLVHLANASYRLGRTLRFDPVAQEVIGDEEANALLRDAPRGYRAPFSVPENI